MVIVRTKETNLLGNWLGRAHERLNYRLREYGLEADKQPRVIAVDDDGHTVWLDWRVDNI